MATPLVSEREDAFTASRIKLGKTGKKKNKKRGYRRFKKRIHDFDVQRLAYIQKMGFFVHEKPVETLPANVIKELAKKHCIRLQEPHRRHRHVTILDLDVWVPYWKQLTGISDMTTLFADNRVGITEEELMQKQFKFLTYGSVFGFKKVDGVDTLIFGVQFFPLDPNKDKPDEASEETASSDGSSNGEVLPDEKSAEEVLSPTEKGYVSTLGKWFYELKRIGKPIKTNRAHKHTGSVGMMIGQGWRAGSDAGFSLGLYKTELTLEEIQENAKKMSWLEYQDKVRHVSEIFGHFFARLGPGISQLARRFMKEHQLPVFGTLKYGETDENCAPASSLYVSHSNFANAPHKDNDVNPYVFGIWATTRASDESVVDDPEEVMKYIHGGQFFFPDYGIAIDFNKCGGIICVIWRAKDDRHATAYTETTPLRAEYMRWGSSIQVGKRTLNATRKVLAEGADVRDAEAYQTGRVGSGVKRKREEESRKRKDAGKKPTGKKPQGKNRKKSTSA
ncbi:hypothetical protein FRC08_006513 [Ceratobasidium sp. 394]|nr:hypothetical protein FRC08_006513 [Ceratobasidium sp. 394]